MFDEIYQLIWQSDENRLTVSGRNATGEWEDETADIKLDQLINPQENRSINLANKRLFAYVNEDSLFDEKRTYVSFIELLDNYAVRHINPALTPEKEEAEIQHFLNMIISTPPIQIALKYINENLGENFTEEQFRVKLKQIWFELYTNYYQGKSNYFASGFEHIFVGESKYQENTGGKKETLGENFGYFCWIKFYLDEKNQRADLTSYKYNIQGYPGLDQPKVLTLQTEHYLTDMRGDVIAEYIHRRGGFFVGLSPEGQIAMATVAYFEGLHGKIREIRRVNIQDIFYDLIVWRNTNPNGSRGDFIRLFFPLFAGAGILPPSNFDIDDSDITEKPDELLVCDRPLPENVEFTVIKPFVNQNDGPVMIVAALPDPIGDDLPNTEWVELKNTTNQDIDLTGWELRDKKGRSQVLTGILAANSSQQIAVTKTSYYALQLSNQIGVITLLDHTQQTIARVKYINIHAGEIVRFENLVMV